jgi:DNA-binding MarR family transcriptional regulator
MNNSPENSQTSGTAASTRPPEGTAQRVAGHSERIGRAEPLSRRILQVLSISSKTSKELAAETGARPESVSRLVGTLRDEGLIESSRMPGDGRRRLHDLTVAGEIELSRHLAYGQKPTPVRPERKAAIEFLRSALAAAVQMRRKSNLLGEAEARLEVVLREARKLGENGLVVDTMSELATTRRQNRKAEDVDELLEELEAIAMGKSLLSSSAVAMPALAYRQYALGRVRVGGFDALAKRANHLISAASLFEELAAAPQSRSSHKWKEREAWSVASLASNLRARSQYEKALQKTATALRIFEELEDPYGRSHCLFQFGFCLRLLGEFEGAWERLSQAQELAKENSFERFQADSLMQLGEVLRCRGEMEEARGALEESRERSVRMGLGVTQAFAHSALGAVAFHRRELQPAQLELQRAEEGFHLYEHRKGLALNARRRAAVARLLSREEGTGDLKRVDELVRRALEYYQALHSPAGETACLVESGRLRIMRDREAPETVEALLKMLGSRTPERDLLELDPWVPRVIESFARETEDRSLIQRARDFIVEADRNLGELARKSLRRAAAIVGRGGEDGEDDRRPHHSTDFGSLPPWEMGGEARQELDAVEPSLA